MSSSRRRRTRGNSVDGSDSDRETRGRESNSPPRTRRSRGKRRNRRGGGSKSLRKLADMYKDVPTNARDEREEHEREEREREEREREEREREERDRDEPVSEQSYDAGSEERGDDDYQEKLRILDKIEAMRQQRQSLKDRMREWEREYCDDERHPLENYRERDYIPEDAKEAYENYEEVQDNIAQLEKDLDRLDVKLRRLRDEKDAEAEGYEDIFKNARKELLRAKEKRDKVVEKIQEQVQEKQEASGEMKMIEHESDEIQEAIIECQEDVDLINQYDVDLETKSIVSLQEIASSLDRDIEVLHAQAKNAIEEERNYEAQRKHYQEDADVQCENLAILRKKDEKVVKKSRDILRKFKNAFNPLRFAEIAREENSRTTRRSIAGFLRRKQAPMSNEKYDHCRRSIKQIEDVLRAIPDELQPRVSDVDDRSHEDDSGSENLDDFNAELRSLIVHLLNQTGKSMLLFTELLVDKNDIGDDRMYSLMHKLEDNFEYENEIEMIKANANSTHYTRTLKRWKVLKKMNRQLRDEADFRKESLRKFRDSQSKYRRTCRDNKDMIMEMNEYEIDNKQMRKEVKDLEDDIENVNSDLSKTKAHLNDARNLVWSSVRNIGSEKRGPIREKRAYKEGRNIADYDPSDSDDAESLRGHCLRDLARWEDDQGRSKRAEPSKYPRSGGKDSYERETRGGDSYNTPGGYDSPKGCSTPKGSRSRSPRRGRHSPHNRRTPGYDEYDNKCEDPPCEDTPGAYRDGSRRSRSMRESTSPDRSPRPYTRGGSASPSPPLER